MTYNCYCWEGNWSDLSMRILGKLSELGKTFWSSWVYWVLKSEMKIKWKKLNAVTNAIDQIYFARNLNIIMPFAFKRNLITYSFTHSKTAAKLYRNWESLGNYAMVTDTLLQQGDELKCPTDADVINTID